MRKKRVYKKYYNPDLKFDRIDLGRFINSVMWDGKKSLAEKLVYGALDIVKGNQRRSGYKFLSRA
jgi:small subunit ribosomal protein S7